MMEDNMKDYKEFFKELEDYNVRLYFYENNQCFTIEELYQAIKARLKAELKLLCKKCPDQPECGIYEDKEGFCITERAEDNGIGSQDNKTIPNPNERSNKA